MAYGSSSPSRRDDICDQASSGKPIDPLAEVTILVCNTCRLQSEPHLDPRPGLVLAQNVIAAGAEAGVNVLSVGCLGNCKRGLSAAILRKGSWSYVFGGLNPGNADDLVSGAKVFAASNDGFMPFRERPEALKRGLIARIPTFDSLKDLP
ncbi:hypothetical protein GCM10011385_37020 [Nitratireductor aestuarii]|uniref:Metal-binding protein n=1 Tax=Nitratireductor aestuarii TaxID=1735103 RepID=A0A916S3B3_9HYPH|nr:DUF1636 family protein [Nitratireductor aestuarii]GGA79419.1 hypothetical protein GCM10011385_37020 [Nitratireductor aestuarii]